MSLLHPRHVTPFVMGPHKSDERDAFAITLAAGCPEIPRIVAKERDARELQGLLRLHHGLVCQRTSQINRLRGLLREQGWVFSKGVARGLAGFRVALEALSERSGDLFVTVFGEELSALEALNCREKALKRRLDRLAREDWQCRLLMSIPGLGPLSALALVATVADASVFDAACGFAAWLGLVPRQHGTGGKMRLGSITRHGNSYIRRNLVQGAKSLIWAATGKAAEPNPCCRLRRWIGVNGGVKGPDFRHAFDDIPNSLQNPKILVGYDPEIIGDGISPFCPLLWQSSAEEIEDSVDEVPEVGMEPVVGHFAVHDSP